MATLWITEYSEIPLIVNGLPAPLALEPPVAEQTVTYTTSTASNAFNSKTKYVRLYASADCHILFGTAPTATAAKQKIAGGQEYWRAVNAASTKVAAYDGSS